MRMGALLMGDRAAHGEEQSNGTGCFFFGMRVITTSEKILSSCTGLL